MTKLLTDALRVADRQAYLVETFAAAIADEMQQMHGGEWRVQIDHEVKLVAIVQRCQPEGPINAKALRRVV